MERRKSQRHNLQLQLEVSGEAQNGQPFCEHAQLVNISGGGALFCSHQVDRYYQGQMLETHILLPGPAATIGKMKTTATVSRLNGNKSDKIKVSIQFQKRLKFFRVKE